MRVSRLVLIPPIALYAVLMLACAARADTPRVAELFRFDGNNGSRPMGPLTVDAAGDLFGVTTFGGRANNGVVFELSPPPPGSHTWTEQTLYKFKGGSDGAFPTAGLVFDRRGDLYGTTSGGGRCLYACGTLFSLTPPATQGGKWTKTTLHMFSGPEIGDGGQPNSRLIMDAAGDLFGSTFLGGRVACSINPGPCGDVYELAPPTSPGGSWTISVLYTFAGLPNGAFPGAGITADADGNLYGSASEGGTGSCTDGEGLLIGCGTMWELSKVGGSWTETTLFDFHPIESEPGTDPLLSRTGALFGTSGYDVFRLAPRPPGTPWNEVLLIRFPAGIAGTITSSDPIAGPFGRLFGTTHASGLDGYGTVYRLDPPDAPGAPWTLMTIATYTGGFDASQPSGGLVLGKDGLLYGATASNAKNDHGTIIKIRP